MLARDRNRADAPVPSSGFLELGGVTLVAETVAAVDRAIAPGTEGDHRFIPAFRTYYGVHFSGTAVETAGPLVSPSGRAARLAALGVVNESSGVEKFLFTYGKREFPSAVYAHESPIC